MSRTILMMAGGTGGWRVFGSGRAARLTFATLTLAYAEMRLARHQAADQER